jgi:hypothetical protein
MPLKCKISVEFVMSDIWCSQEDFHELGQEGVREVIMEDIIAFLEEFPGGFENHLLFEWCPDTPPYERKDANGNRIYLH